MNYNGYNNGTLNTIDDNNNAGHNQEGFLERHFGAFISLGFAAILASCVELTAYSHPEDREWNFIEVPAVATVLAKHEDKSWNILKLNQPDYKLVLSFASWNGDISVDKNVYDNAKLGEHYIVHYNPGFYYSSSQPYRVTNIQSTTIEPQLSESQLMFRIFEAFPEEKAVKYQPNLHPYYNKLNSAKTIITSSVAQEGEQNWFIAEYKSALLKNILDSKQALPDVYEFIKKAPLRSDLPKDISVTFATIIGHQVIDAYITSGKNSHYVEAEHRVYYHSNLVSHYFNVSENDYKKVNVGDNLILKIDSDKHVYNYEFTDLAPQLTQGQINGHIFENFSNYNGWNQSLTDMHYAFNQAPLIKQMVTGEDKQKQSLINYQNIILESIIKEQAIPTVNEFINPNSSLKHNTNEAQEAKNKIHHLRQQHDSHHHHVNNLLK